MINTLSKAFVEKRAKFAIAAIALLLVTAAGCAFLELKTHYSTFFDPSDPNLVAHQEMESKFTQSDNVFFIIFPKNNDVFTVENLEAINKLTKYQIYGYR